MSEPPDCKRAVSATVLLAVVMALGFLYYRSHTIEESVEGAGMGAEVVPGGAEPPPPEEESSEAQPQNAGTNPREHTDRAPLILSPATARTDRSARFGVIAGHVLSWSTNAPIAGAELTFAAAGRTVAVHTDEEGAFHYSAGAAAEHTLSIVTADGYRPYAPEWDTSPLTFRPERWERVEGVVVYLVPDRPYSGLVVNAEGEPVAGASIRLLSEADAERASMPPGDNAWESGPDGTFTFHAADGALLEARHPEAGRGRARVDFGAQASYQLRITLSGEAQPGMVAARISGQVLTDDGTPMPEVTVRAVPRPDNAAEPSAALHPIGEATTDDDGRFEIEGVDVGPHLVTAGAPDYATARVNAEAPARDVTLTLGPEALLTGKVIDEESGEPLASSTVVVLRETGPLAREVIATETTFAADGGFTVHGLAAGSYLVQATAYGYAASEPRPVLAEGGAPTDVEIALGRGGTVEGVVVSGEDGPPLANARVSLEESLGDGGSSAVPLFASAVTGEDGHFTLTGVPPGLQNLFAAAQDHHGRLISWVATTGATSFVSIDLTSTEEGEEPGTELVGIGAVLSAHDEGLIIGRVVEGGGADQAGLVPGDVILAVDGLPATELGFSGTFAHIRGPEGTTVQLRVRRAETEREENIDVPRKRIRA